MFFGHLLAACETINDANVYSSPPSIPKVYDEKTMDDKNAEDGYDSPQNIKSKISNDYINYRVKEAAGKRHSFPINTSMNINSPSMC